MKYTLLILTVLSGFALSAETHFSISMGGYDPGYYSAPRIYTAPGYAHGLYRSGVGFNRGGGRGGYWGENPERRHRRAEWNGLRNHNEEERYMDGDSWELREHQQQERRELRHEQFHERNGDFYAAEGPAHGSARDGFYRRR